MNCPNPVWDYAQELIVDAAVGEDKKIASQALKI